MWGVWTRHHLTPPFYDVAGFKEGALSWTRRGAAVTGVDFSADAIRAARA
jgi:hypothetical protein